jgi:hypothetical protein
MLDDQIK